MISTSCFVLPGWWTHMPNSGSTARRTWHPCVGSTPWYRCVRPRTSARHRSHQVLLGRIPAVPDLQSAWVLLLYCASTRANSFLRVCLPVSAESFAVQHDNNVWHCLCQLIGHLPHRPTWERGSLPARGRCCVLGQLGRLLGPHARATSMWQTPWLLHCQTHQLQPLILLVLHSRDLLTDAGFGES